MLKSIAGGITAPKDFKAAGVKAGIKKSGKEDVALILSEKPAVSAAVFTTNTMAAAPVLVSRAIAAQGIARAIAVNSGCANACTGEQGLADARQMVSTTAQLLDISEEEVLIASTGIIGVLLPMDKLTNGIKRAVGELSVNGHEKALQAIMTTDTFAKSCAYEFMLGGVPVRIAGIAKGAGMIHPNMATMLAFITTDAAVSGPVLKKALTDAVNLSFHMITVDGDTSTNDMLAILANGSAGNPTLDDTGSDDYQLFFNAVKSVCINLAKLVIQDGEGATKFLEINVRGAADFEDAKKAAMAIAKSPLVKTAFFGQDPNWGRILCAAGYSGADADPGKISLMLGEVPIVKNGLGVDFDRQQLKTVMADRNIKVAIDLGMGQAEATVWTCDFSYEYVKINAEYST